MKSVRVCKTCGRGEKETRLQKCVICHEFYCYKCRVRKFGKLFCSKTCAELFFFGDDD
jgi:hypothetical protein